MRPRNDMNLMPGEAVVHITRPNFVACIVPPVVFAVTGLIGIIALFASGSTGGGATFGILFTVVGVFMFVASVPKFLAYYFTADLAVTSRRILLRHGLLVRRHFEILLTRVEGLGVNQNILERLTRSGSVFVTGTGAGRSVMHWIDEPWLFRDAARSQIESLGSRGT